jgi:RND superfamily putative drug exporter
MAFGFESWTMRLLSLRVPVLLAWLVIVVVGAAAAVDVPGRLSSSFTVPGSDSDRARTILARSFGERPDSTFTVVFVTRGHVKPGTPTLLERRLHRAARLLPAGTIGTLNAGGGIFYADLRTPITGQEATAYTSRLRTALRDSSGPRAYLTGQPAIQRDLDPILASDLRRGTVIAVALALVVLVAVLGPTVAVLLPFVLAACTSAVALIAIDGLARAIPMISFVRNVVELIALGLAVDYSLFAVCRFREELERGLPVERAVVRTVATAGRSVLFSGLAAALGLALLSLVPVPFVRSLGIAGTLVPLAAVAAALTLQPVLLVLLGRRALSRSALKRARTDSDGRFWLRLSGAITRRPVRFLVVGTALLTVAALPTLRLELTPAALGSLPSSESMRGYALLAHGIGAGAVTPTHIVVDAGPGRRANRGPVYAADQRLANELYRDPEVRLVASGPAPPYSDRSGRFTRVIVVGRHEYGSEISRRFVTRLRDRLIPAARFPSGSSVYAGGAPPQGVDFLARTYGAFPWLVLATLVLTYLLLVRAFRSLLLPLKAVILNVLSVAAAYGMLVLVFRYGIGADLIGVRRGSQLEGWVPIALFATLFGLSIDYEVFMVTRMREFWDGGATNEAAVAWGLQRTGRVVTAAALVMAAAFFGLASGRVPGLQQFGLGLALAVMLDATVIRMLLVPSIMALFGRYNWWLPQRVARLVWIEPSPLELRA